MKLRFRALRYTLAAFILIIFLWWLQGGHLISFLAPKPAPTDIVVLGTANALRWGAANVFGLITGLFK